MARRHAGTARVATAGWRWVLAIMLLAVANVVVAQAGPQKLAPGFEAPARGAKLLLLPADVQLFSISAGSVTEPRADWSDTARAHLRKAVLEMVANAGYEQVMLPEATIDEFGEQLSLQSAVSRAIVTHHIVADRWALPTKQGRLDWTVGDAMQPLAAASGARYALFIRVRDSYASTERKATMAALALLGAFTGVVVVPGMGQQNAQASLIDLDSGRVLWFNNVSRGSGDLREEQAGLESVAALMAGFPATR